MLLPAYINVNQTGIPALRSLSVTVGTTDVRFDFNNQTYSFYLYTIPFIKQNEP